MIKVAFFAEILIADFDGAARTMFQLIDRIDKTQYEFMFIYGQGPDTFREYKTFKTPTLKLPINDDYSLSLPTLSGQKIYDSLDAFSPDVVHIATPSALGFFALKYATKRNIPIISIFHTNFISYIPYYLKNFPFLIKSIERWMIGATQRFYNQCSAVYAPSKRMVSYLTDMGVDQHRLTLWQRGIDTSLFTPAKRDKSRLHQITGNSNPNILFASRLVWEKNITTLAAIYQAFEEQGLNYNLIIVGDGNARKAAATLMPNAFFLGKLDHEELAIIYASADVFVFPSTSETYGNVVIEAMASGLPCVIADGGGSADLVAHGETGYKCQPTVAKEFVDHIQRLVEQPVLRNTVQQKGLLFANNLSWDHLAKRYFADIDLLALSTESTWTWAAS